MDEVTLAGNDTGGAIAQLVVAARPDRVQRLMLASCDAFDNFPPGLPGRTMAMACAVPGGLRLAMASLRVPLLRRLPMTFGWMSHRPIPRATFDGWLDAYAAHPGVRRDVNRFMKGVDRHQLVAAADRFSSFTGPVSVVWAEHDRVMPVRHAYRLAEVFPNSSLQLVPDAGTLIPFDQPAVLADRITALLAAAPR